MKTLFLQLQGVNFGSWKGSIFQRWLTFWNFLDGRLFRIRTKYFYPLQNRPEDSACSFETKTASQHCFVERLLGLWLTGKRLLRSPSAPNGRFVMQPIRKSFSSPRKPDIFRELIPVQYTRKLGTDKIHRLQGPRLFGLHPRLWRRFLHELLLHQLQI